ncbi:MAG: hypothetical protein GY724_10040 [Actinomycetia bacterium]|nr:hypothetical protein [Actinomycetes bacterium]
MFASTITSVIIGLIFVFFVCSLAVSGMNEAVRKALNTRSKTLWTAIQRILSEDVALPQEPKLTARIGGAPERSEPPTSRSETTPSASLFDQLFNHPIIGRLDPARLNRPSKISHIPPADFARALVDILTPEEDDNKVWGRLQEGIDGLPRPLRSQFQLLYEEAGHDVLKFREGIEGWFNNSMERVSTWYKKRTRWAMLVYGLIVAIGLNVSAVNVTAELYENEIVREAVVELAAHDAALANDQVQSCTDRECVEVRIGDLVDTGLPVLWRDCDHDKGYTACGFEDGWAVVGTVSGWLITAAALSLGASFWFTILKRAFRLRSGLTGTTG